MSANEPEIPDIDCLQRLRRGDVNAFETIVRHFERPLRAWLATAAPPGVDGDEIAQKSFIAAYKRIEDFEPGTNFSAWLFSIARWQLKTEVTRLRRIADYQSRYAPDLMHKLHAEVEIEPELVAVRLEHLGQCVKQLGASVSRFITWRYHDEIPLDEMARLSGRSVAAVKKQLWLLRQQLQRCIDARMAAATETELS